MNYSITDKTRQTLSDTALKKIINQKLYSIIKFLEFDGDTKHSIK